MHLFPHLIFLFIVFFAQKAFSTTPTNELASSLGKLKPPLNKYSELIELFSGPHWSEIKVKISKELLKDTMNSIVNILPGILAAPDLDKDNKALMNTAFRKVCSVTDVQTNEFELAAIEFLLAAQSDVALSKTTRLDKVADKLVGCIKPLFNIDSFGGIGDCQSIVAKFSIACTEHPNIEDVSKSKKKKTIFFKKGPLEIKWWIWLIVLLSVTVIIVSIVLYFVVFKKKNQPTQSL